MARVEKPAAQLIDELKSVAEPENLAGMARFGIDTEKALGVSMPNIRAIGKTVVRNHSLAIELWHSEIHEARILASLVDIPSEVSARQMGAWAADFNSWDLCDQVCGNLFDRASEAETMIRKWADDNREFVRRAAFATIAWRAVHLKNEPDDTFLAYLPFIEAASVDNRNFVKKAVNWALRQIGKRNASLHGPALTLAVQLHNSPEKSAQWIGRDAARELDSQKVCEKLGLS